MYRNWFVLTITLLVLLQTAAFADNRSVLDTSADVECNGAKGGALISTVNGPAGWTHVYALAYHDGYDMLYGSRGGSSGNNALAYGYYSGGTSVTWVEFANVNYVSGLGCYQDDQLYAITHCNPLSPVPYYLYTWQLDGSGIPTGSPDIYPLGSTFITGAMGGCDWDGQYLWVLDQNFEAKADKAVIYKYDVNTHSIIDSWSYSETGGFGLACVWDQGNLNIWVSEFYPTSKIQEHSDTGSPGITYNLPISPNDIAYKYDTDFDGPGFFVGCYGSNTIDLYDHTLTSLESSSWGAIKAGFSE